MAPVQPQSAMLYRRSIVSDLEEVTKASQSVAAFLAKKKDILEDFLLQDLIEADGFYDHHLKLVSSCGYLKTLSEDNTIYSLYHDVIHRHHARTFSDFN